MSLPLILVLCTGNSCRSHLAEGLLQRALGPGYVVASAGSQPAGYVHPLAIRAMAEVGIGLSEHTSKHLDEFLTRDWILDGSGLKQTTTARICLIPISSLSDPKYFEL